MDSADIVGSEAHTVYAENLLGIRDTSFYDVDALEQHVAIGHHWDEATADFSPDRILRLPTAMSAAGASLALSAAGLLTFLRSAGYGGRVGSLGGSCRPSSGNCQALRSILFQARTRLNSISLGRDSSS